MPKIPHLKLDHSKPLPKSCELLAFQVDGKMAAYCVIDMEILTKHKGTKPFIQFKDLMKLNMKDFKFRRDWKAGINQLIADRANISFAQIEYDPEIGSFVTQKFCPGGTSPQPLAGPLDGL